MSLRLSKQLFISCLTVAFVTFGCGDGGSGGIHQAPLSSGNAQPNSASPRPASITARLRVLGSVPGAQQLASSPVPWLAWFSRPAHAANEVYTLPGARVDAVGMTWAIADQEGVARFRSLPPQHYRFVVSTTIPGVVFQTLLSAAPGATIDLDITELTTAATFVALQAQPLSDGGGADMESLITAFDAGQLTSFNTLLASVEQQIASGQSWLDESFFPESSEIQSQIAEANESVNFIARQFPVPGQSRLGSGPLILGLSFSRPVDQASLAPIGGGQWSLQGSFGSINATNLAGYGTVAYTDHALDLDGQAIPAHTLYFRLSNLSLPEGTLTDMTLSLETLPEDSKGRPFLCVRQPSNFARWSFIPGGEEIPGAAVGSNVLVGLDWLASACQGSTVADLSQIPAPVSTSGSTTPDHFSLEYYQHSVPFSIPGRDRALLVDLLDADTIQLGDIYQLRSGREEVGYSLSYQERVYTDPGGGPTSIFEWRASGGTLSVVGLEGGRIVLELETTMRREDGLDSFCLQTTIDSQFP